MDEAHEGGDDFFTAQGYPAEALSLTVPGVLDAMLEHLAREADLEWR